MDPTVGFDLLSFNQIRSVPLSPRPIARSRLRGRTLVARTRTGNIAKMHVRTAGTDLLFDRLTVYTFDSCILQMASDLVLRSGRWLDLDEARETRSGGDLRWRGGNGADHLLEPGNGAALFMLPDSLGVLDLRAVRHDADRVSTEGLRDQALYCRTRDGRLARLLVDAGPALKIRELTVLDGEGNVHLERTGLELPTGAALDLDTGEVGGGGRHALRYAMKADGRGDLGSTDGTVFVPSQIYEVYKYLPLFASSAIRNAMVYEDGNGALSYDHWSEARKAQLREWLHLRDTGQPFPISGPPPLDDDGTMTRCAAWKIYLAHVAQSFWVDANRLVPWRLRDANAEHLEHLLDSRRLLHFGEEGHKFSTNVMGRVTDWAPVYSWDFLVANGLIGSTQWVTIKRLADWVRDNLRHIIGYQHDNDGGPFDSQLDQWEYIFGYRGPPPVNRMIDPLPGRDRISHGCWGTDGFLAAVLRSANIPVRHGRSNFSGDNHSRAEFFTVGRNLMHGDDLYNGMVAPGANTVPIHRIFLTNQELDDLIDSPEPLPGKTVAETATHNKSKRMTGLAVEYMTNWLLQKRCKDLGSGASGPASELQQALKDYYTPSQMAQIIQDCDAALAAIPGGCGAVWH